jgi:hypothetical protein
MLNSFFKKHFIKLCFYTGWIILLVSLWVDIFIPNSHLWFPRSGAVLCMLSLAAEFRLSRMEPIYSCNTVEEAMEYHKASYSGVYPETAYDKVIKFSTHISVAVGTLVWAYGDFLVAN